MAKKHPNDYKKQADIEAQKFLASKYAEYHASCNCYLNFFDFLKKEYDCDPDYWIRQARRFGFEIIKRGNNFYMKIQVDGANI